MADSETTMMAIKKVTLTNRHLKPGRTRHTLGDEKGSFPPFTSLVITRDPRELTEDSGYYLMHLCANGQVADTYHLSLEDAFHQAEFEFGVQRGEWVDSNEPWS